MKTSRLVLVALPAAALALGAAALTMWTRRRHAASKSNEDRASVPGSIEEVAAVAEAMAEEGGTVLITEVEALDDDDTLLTEALFV